jgi:hypothetical protein
MGEWVAWTSRSLSMVVVGYAVHTILFLYETLSMAKKTWPCRPPGGFY